MFHPDIDVAANEHQTFVAQQCPGEQSCLAEDLESVTNPDNISTSPGKRDNFLHNRRTFGNGAATQIVAVRKPSGKDDNINPFERSGFMPEQANILTENILQYIVRVVVAIRPGKQYDAKLRPGHRSLPVLSYTICESGFMN